MNEWIISEKKWKLFFFKKKESNGKARNKKHDNKKIEFLH